MSKPPLGFRIRILIYVNPIARLHSPKFALTRSWRMWVMITRGQRFAVETKLYLWTFEEQKKDKKVSCVSWYSILVLFD